MKNEQTNQALTLIGIALLMVASGGESLQFDDVIKKTILKAIGVEDDNCKKEKRPRLCFASVIMRYRLLIEIQ